MEANQNNKNKTRRLTVQGWLGRTVTVEVTGGTLKEAKREALRLTESMLLPGRRTVVAIEEV